MSNDLCYNIVTLSLPTALVRTGPAAEKRLESQDKEMNTPFFHSFIPKPAMLVRGGWLLFLLTVIPFLAACGEQGQVVPETQSPVVLTTQSPAASETQERQATSEQNVSFTTPHPILGDVRVRRAIAYCTNRDQLIASVYPFLSEEQRQKMFMHTFVPQGHWAEATKNITVYPFDPEKGKALLDEAGWKQRAPGQIRTNEQGQPLKLEFVTTDAKFRITWATVLEQQLRDHCGIEIVRKHAPASWVFGNTTGLSRRQFELAGYAWVGQADPGGSTLYACNQIPRPENNWEGQNIMGWCNERASRAIVAANNIISREERIRQYAIVQEEFTKDMVSLPLFNRFEAAAASNKLKNFRPDPSERSYLVDVDTWEMSDGSDTVVIGITQQPASLFALVESANVTQMLHDLLSVRVATSKGYDYQPVGVTRLPTIENGGAIMKKVPLREGDIIWSIKGEAEPLAPGVEFVDANNEVTVYQGGIVYANQLTVTFELVKGLTWEDGQPLKKADLELAHKIDCDPESGAVSLQVCKSILTYEVKDDHTVTITYLPGALWPEYFIQLGGAYPSHQKISDGRRLADVPAKEWSSLPEVARRPLSYGPYRIVSWEEGQRITFEANPYYYKGAPKIKRVVAEIFSDTQAAVAQLLAGHVDVIGPETLGAGVELETAMKAGAEGKIQFFPITSATWEHLDMNLFAP